MLFMPFLLALTLFAQSASCPEHWEKEDGEIRRATFPAPAKAIGDFHDLSTYPTIPKYDKIKPLRSSYPSTKEFKKASFKWRQQRWVDAIPKVYVAKKDSKQISYALLEEIHEITTAIKGTALQLCFSHHAANTMQERELTKKQLKWIILER